MAEAVKVLQLASDKFDLGFELSYDELGGAAVDKYGVPLADETLERARAADAILLGAVGGPKWDTIDPAIRPERGLLKIRSQLACSATCVLRCSIRSWPMPRRSSPRSSPVWIS